jgi:hypothetical protein
MHVVLDRLACASSGVWNSGAMSTSKPRSANAVAITLAPRSWPSWPSLAIRMRGTATLVFRELADFVLHHAPSFVVGTMA